MGNVHRGTYRGWWTRPAGSWISVAGMLRSTSSCESINCAGVAVGSGILSMTSGASAPGLEPACVCVLGRRDFVRGEIEGERERDDEAEDGGEATEADPEDDRVAGPSCVTSGLGAGGGRRTGTAGGGVDDDDGLTEPDDNTSLPAGLSTPSSPGSSETERSSARKRSLHSKPGGISFKLEKGVR
uniref:Uncharacterized protein n=1 Tax=Anopheles atroparvus TaxID=41427 RepID=A0A182IT35_ANOAO